MWCAQCQQDIPAIERRNGGLACLRCGELFRSRDGSDPRAKPLGAAEQPKTCQLANDGSEPSSLFSLPDAGGEPAVTGIPYIPWEWDQLLEHWEGILRHSQPGCAPGGFRRVEGKHAEPRPNHSRNGRSRRFTPSSRAAGKSDSVAWLVFLVGAAVLVCGANLVGWGLVLGSPELGLWGILIAVIGLVLFVSGIFFRLGELKPKSGLRPPDGALRFAWQSCHDCEPAARTAASHDTHGKADQG